MKNIITLFDMDGTLTEPRKAYDNKLDACLSNLSLVSDIGIVSGSDYKYITEQMHHFLRKTCMRYCTQLFPCNGTKHYTPPVFSSDEFELKSEADMKEVMGADCFYELVTLLLREQVKHMTSLPSLTGHFIDYRGSMINWCPIGRNADHQQREAFVQWDTTYSFRGIELVYLSNLKRMKELDLVVKLGGDTSFDIYPNGWDKTYCLQHLSEYDQIWFVGDRCGAGGNDKELYDHLGPSRAFATKSPANTVTIINEVIIPQILGEQND